MIDMAQVLSGSVKTNGITAYGNTASFTLNWSATQDIATNASTIDWTLIAVISPATGNYRTVYNASVTIDGTKYSMSSRVSAYDGTVIMSASTYGKKVITHNADGSKKFDISISVAVGQNAVNCTGQDTFELVTIARASEPTCSNVVLGNAVTINTNRKSSDFTHTIQVLVNNSVKETFTNVTDSKSWTPSLATYAPLNTSGSTVLATIKCITYKSGAQIGSEKTCNVTLTIPDNSSTKPTTSISISEANQTMISKAWGIYVQGKSQLNVKITGSPKYNAKINAYSASVNGSNYSSQSFITGSLLNSGKQSIKATTRDSRGFSSSSASLDYDVVAYSNPKITQSSALRTDASGNESDEGTYLTYSFVASVSSINNKNSALYRIGYKKSTDSSYTYVTVANTGYSINIQNKILQNVTLDTNSSYDVIFEVTDAFTTSKITKEKIISSGYDLLNFNASGKALAIGKVSEAEADEKLLEIGITTKYLGKELLTYEVVDEW